MTEFPKTLINTLEPVRWEDILQEVKNRYGDLTKLPEDKLAKLCELKAIIKSRERDYRILYYEPQEYQKPFHESCQKIRLVLGSNQCGKSTVGIVEALRICLGLDKQKLELYPPPVRGRICANDWAKGIGENIENKLNEWLPKQEVANVRKNSQGYTTKIIFKNGSVIDFLTYEQYVKEPQVAEGWVGHFCFMDELPPRGLYIATLRGLIKNKGLLWICATPLAEPWIYDEIYLQASNDKNIGVWTWGINDNKYLTQEEIEDFKKRLSPDEIEARIYGRFKHLSGLIYKEFNPQIHCIKSFEIPDDWNCYCAIDYHPRTPVAVVWIAVSPHNIYYVYDELWIDKSIKEIADAIKVKERGKNIIARFIDPLSATPSRNDTISPQRELLRYGISTRVANKDFPSGKNAVSELLKLDKENKPGIYFFSDTVPLTIQAFGRYQWDEYSSPEREGEKQQPKKQYAHFPDCVRYICVTRPRYKSKDMIKVYEQQIRQGHKYTGYSYG